VLLVSGPRPGAGDFVIGRDPDFPGAPTPPIFWPPDANVVLGTDGDDVLVGTQGRDCIFGFAGDDVIRGRSELIRG
jgi:Ca2+-binding RTX toxin-like protein